MKQTSIPLLWFFVVALAIGCSNEPPPDDDDDSSLPDDRLWQPTTAKWFVVAFGAALGYSILRYHITSEVGWAHFPLFILNKATSLAAVIFVGSSYLIGKAIRWYDDDKALRLVVIKFCGLMGFFLAAIHAFMSVAILRPTTTSAGSIKLTASAPGLTSGEVTVTTTALSPSAL